MDLAVVFLLLAQAALAWWILCRLIPLENARPRLALLAAILFCVVLRGLVLDYQTLDYKDFLTLWVDFFRTRGGFRALQYSVGNYNIPYLYFMALFSYSSIWDLYLIKLLSFFFDFFLAISSLLLVSVYSDSKLKKIACFFFVFNLPTVFLNSAVWAQCDGIYTAFLIFGIYLALVDRPWHSVVSFTMALAFKLQAVFVLPIVFILMLKKKISFKHAIAAPVTYFITVLPAVIAGRPLLDTLTLYFNQTGSIGDGLNYNSSSVFAIIGNNVSSPKSASRTAILCAFAFMVLVILICALRYKQIGNLTVLICALLFAVGIPFLLPHMHDRYFYAADILSVILFCVVPETAPLFLLVQFASLLGYHAYLRMRFLFPMRYGAYALIVVLLVSLVLLFFSFCKRREAPISEGVEDPAPVSE